MDTQTIIDEVRQIISRVNFPARKQDIIGAARDAQVSEDTASAVQQLPDQKYNTLQDILEKLPLGDIESQIERFM